LLDINNSKYLSSNNVFTKELPQLNFSSSDERLLAYGWNIFWTFLCEIKIYIIININIKDYINIIIIKKKQKKYYSK
jgi:hypothetical protein